VYDEGEWTPDVTPGTGSFTTLGTKTGKYVKIGKLVTVTITVNITTNGTAGGHISISLPFAPAYSACGAGRELAVTGVQLQMLVDQGSAKAIMFAYNNGYPGVNGCQLIATATYQATT
jgi:hypothetical protein